MRSTLRRSRGLAAAGVIVALGLGAAPPLLGRALALGPTIPYTDLDQARDQPPTGWLLMAPPTTNSGLTVDTQARLASWITYGRYNTLQDCTTTIQMVRNGVIPNSGLPAQALSGAISPNAIPGVASQPGYGGMPPGYPGMQPGYPSMQPGYPSMQPGYPGAQAGSPPMQPGYPGMQPGYQGMQPGYPGMQPGYTGMQQGYSGMQPGYGSNQPGSQPMIQQPAQLMTRQQVDAAYCFANNDQRLQGLIAPPPGQQPLNGAPGGLGQTIPGVGP